MQYSDSIKEADVVFLFTDIGRGHPSYLDGICKSLANNHPDTPSATTNVFAMSRGFSLVAWKLVRFLYRFGSRGGLITALYTSLRRILGDGGDTGLLMSLLGQDIRKEFKNYRGVIVVAHPLLAKILSDQNRVAYQHGEFAVPPEAIPAGCEMILVPDQDCAEQFTSAGIDCRNVTVTGQCIDSHIAEVAEDAYRNRRRRLDTSEMLTAALFTSGATPRPHIQKIVSICKSLSMDGHRVTIFTANSVKYKSEITRFLEANDIAYNFFPEIGQKVTVIHCDNRLQEDEICGKLFPQFDIFVAPAHERVHWSLGLGLPQFVLCPYIGTFSPLNARRVLSEKVGREVTTSQDCNHFAGLISELRQSGELSRMAERGFKPDRLSGFDNCAKCITHLINSTV